MLSQLYRLQELEMAEQALITERATSQEFLELREIKAAFEEKKQAYLALVAACKDLEEKVATFPERLLYQQSRIDKEQEAMYDGSVSNTKTLAAREAQLITSQGRLAALQEEQIAAETAYAEKRQAATALKAEMEAEFAQFRIIKEAFLAAQKVRDARAEELEKMKNALNPLIPAEDLAWFEQEKGKFGGTPVAQLSEGWICSGCHTMATAVAYKRMQQGQRIVCEGCARLLFIGDV